MNKDSKATQNYRFTGVISLCLNTIAIANALRSKPTAKSVRVYDKSNTLIGVWASISLCAKELKCDPTTVWKVCEKRYPLKSHRGYRFEYDINV